MQTGNYSFHCRFNEAAVLPTFKGSTLRGGLGHALKRVTCALRQKQCDGCLLLPSCAYAGIFEVKKYRVDDGEQVRTAHVPHPYLLIPPEEETRDYRTGDSFQFQVRLFGHVNDYLPHILYGVQEMGRSGLGKKGGSQGKFELEQVYQGEELLFSNNSLHGTAETTVLELQPPAGEPVSAITVSFKTPLRLKHINRLQDELPFHLLIRAALRRCSSLENCYGDGEPDIDYRGLVARAQKVEVADAHSFWREVKRYSNRQKKTMFFGGISGEVTYRGANLAEFLPLLRYCEQTHLGKQTTFGLGQISVRTQELAA